MKKYITATIFTVAILLITSFGPDDSAQTNGKFIGTETTYGTCTPYNGQGGRGIQSKTETFYLFGIAISSSTTWVDCETPNQPQDPILSID